MPHRDFLGGSVVKIPCFYCRDVQSLLGNQDPVCCAPWPKNKVNFKNNASQPFCQGGSTAPCTSSAMKQARLCPGPEDKMQNLEEWWGLRKPCKGEDAIQPKFFVFCFFFSPRHTRNQVLQGKNLIFLFCHSIQHVGSHLPDQGSNPSPLHWKAES